MSLLLSEVKQATIKAVSDKDSVLIIKIFRGQFEHHVKEDSEENRARTQTCFEKGSKMSLQREDRQNRGYATEIPATLA